MGSMTRLCWAARSGSECRHGLLLSARRLIFQELPARYESACAKDFADLVGKRGIEDKVEFRQARAIVGVDDLGEFLLRGHMREVDGTMVEIDAGRENSLFEGIERLARVERRVFRDEDVEIAVIEVGVGVHGDARRRPELGDRQVDRIRGLDFGLDWLGFGLLCWVSRLRSEVRSRSLGPHLCRLVRGSPTEPSGTLLSNQAQIRDSRWFLRQRGSGGRAHKDQDAQVAS
jgi:hypothetical protein